LNYKVIKEDVNIEVYNF